MIAGIVAALILVTVIVGVVFAVRSGSVESGDKAAAVVNKQACIERHLKAAGILEKGFRSIRTNDTGSSEAECKPLIEELRQKSIEPFMKKIESDPNGEPLKKCLISGFSKSDLADQLLAASFFDKDSMNDKARFQKAENAGANSVLRSTMECAGQMGFPGLGAFPNSF